MRLKFIWPGKTKDEHLRALQAEYFKRLSRFVRCEVIETRDYASSDRTGVENEGKRMLSVVSPSSVVVLLAVSGAHWTSHELAGQMQRWENDATKEVAIVVGGQDGVSPAVEGRANISWSLSRMTLTHEMARVLVIEQIYRAYTINRGLPYQK